MNLLPQSSCKLGKLEQYTEQAIRARDKKIITLTIEKYNECIISAMRANKIGADRSEKIMMDALTIFSDVDS